MLGGYGASSVGSDNDKHYVDSSGRMHIKLEPGKVLGDFEIAVGDSGYDKTRPSSEQGTRTAASGPWATRSCDEAGLKDGTTDDLIVKANVPPQGVISGGPKQQGYVTKPGDEIVVESRAHKSWVMGCRATYMES